VKGMEAEGLIQHVGGEYLATKRGVEFLQDRFRTLRSFVETSAREMEIIDEAVAMAGEVIREGDRVGLFMERGGLVARRRASPSVGVAATRAKRGDLLWVRDLVGIVDLRPGKISIVRLSPRARGHSGRGLRHVRPDVVAAFDLRGRRLAATLAVDRVIEFAVVPGAIEAAQRGLNVLLLCPEDRVAEVVAAIEDANARSEDKIPYETVARP
ncbi:MAG TPA: hypothetical protein VGR51_01080, partial [Thermoplasmata archaeon]|nr:hypothetical protein [Thermoplasmata archaeon]